MTHDALIIGAGIIGSSIARALAAAGLSVALVERDRPGAGASSAAFGILQLQANPGAGPQPLLALWQAAMALYPDFVAAIESETGLGVEFRTEGRILVATTDAHEAELATFLADQIAAGLPAEPLTAPEIQTLEPDLTPTIRGGIFLPAQRLVDNIKLTQAVALAASRRGAELVAGQPVQGLMIEDDRVVGALVGGEPWCAGVVINAAGCWSGRLDPRSPAPVKPVRGQGVALHDAPPRFRHVVYDGRCSLVARQDGRLLIGTTTEPTAGYDARPTAGAAAELLAAAAALAPHLARSPLLGAWAGLRPFTPDGLPLLGQSARFGGLIWATGHAGMGILLAPLTAELIADQVLGRAPRLDLTPFAPGRFDPPA